MKNILKYLLVGIACALIGGGIGFFVNSSLKNKNEACGKQTVENIESDKKNEEKETNEEKTEEIEKCNKESEEDKEPTKVIELRENVYINSKKELVIDNKVIDTNIKTFVEIPGEGSTCNGSTYYLFLTGTGTVSSWYTDSYDCGQEVKYTKNLHGLKDVEAVNFSLASGRKIVVVFKDGSTKEITAFEE